MIGLCGHRISILNGTAVEFLFDYVMIIVINTLINYPLQPLKACVNQTMIHLLL
ncbi:hypothetical protein CMALT430_320007 [Carnobacterium maltaromaticum]|nr:hypothetical protein CMALT430_320007 [Carnobacterium maltaromaticum]